MNISGTLTTLKIVDKSVIRTVGVNHISPCLRWVQDYNVKHYLLQSKPMKFENSLAVYHWTTTTCSSTFELCCDFYS